MAEVVLFNGAFVKNIDIEESVLSVIAAESTSSVIQMSTVISGGCHSVEYLSSELLKD